ncbi:hypothetical protein FHD45_11710 [Escherichia coli]|nr:hypothetical protein [Escherichia coli]EFB2840560.1 hypothetical protein [Escherichia coli]PTN25657.1 hypothetical protein A7589_14265 [Escherichia sp. MOD1-EC6475]
MCRNIRQIKKRLFWPLQIVDKVLVVDAGCGVNALSGLQNHANSIHCRCRVGPISLRIGRFDVCHQS